jgi:predicted kinase
MTSTAALNEIVLIVFGGLPGTGKSTIAQIVALRLGAVWLRIDAIEHAIQKANVLAAEVGPAGYNVANSLAEANLKLGLSVVVDAVNPVAVCREAWRDIAGRLNVKLIEIEVFCSDKEEHRRRVETRRSDLEGFPLPTWDAVLNRRYEPWIGPQLVLDTAMMQAAEAATAIIDHMAR